MIGTTKCSLACVIALIKVFSNFFVPKMVQFDLENLIQGDQIVRNSLLGDFWAVFLVTKADHIFWLRLCINFDIKCIVICPP
jgi:hypothetical protein